MEWDPNTRSLMYKDDVCTLSNLTSIEWWLRSISVQTPCRIAVWWSDRNSANVHSGQIDLDTPNWPGFDYRPHVNLVADTCQISIDGTTGNPPTIDLNISSTRLCGVGLGIVRRERPRVKVRPYGRLKGRLHAAYLVIGKPGLPTGYMQHGQGGFPEAWVYTSGNLVPVWKDVLGPGGGGGE